MKKKIIKLRLLLALAVVGAVALSSCSKEDALVEKESPEADVDSRLAKITITAFNGEEKPASKTVLAGDELKQVHWLGEEKIAVFNYQKSTKPNEFTSTNKDTSATTTFEGTIEGIDNLSKLNGLEVIGLYPYNADATITSRGIVTTTLSDEQEAVPNSFANNLMISMAKSTSNATRMKFFNVCGGLCFTLEREGVKQVTITAKGGEYIAGEFTVAFDEVGGNEVPVVQRVVNGKSSITMKAPDGGTFVPGVPYYIVTLPTKLSNGVMIDLLCDVDDRAYYYIEEISGKEGQSLEFKRSIFGKKKVFGHVSSHLGHEYVDLGLPSGTLWATMNVGARNIYDFGDYFAWGDTELYYLMRGPIRYKDDKSEGFALSSYKYYDGSGMTKYTDEYSVLEPEDDAATFYWSGEWSTPTSDAWKELLENCTLKKQYGTYILTSKVNGNSISLPCGGFFGRDGHQDYYMQPYGENYYAHYWSSSGRNYNGMGPTAIGLEISVGNSADLTGSNPRYFGKLVRPVIARSLDTLYCEKVTVTPDSWEGEYLIISNNKALNLYKYNYNNINSWAVGSTIQIVNNKIPWIYYRGKKLFSYEDYSGERVRIIFDEGNYYLMHSGRYIYYDATRRTYSLGFDDTKTPITLSISDDGIVSIISDGATLRFASNRFTFSNSETSNIALYKFVNLPEGIELPEDDEEDWEDE